MAYDFPPPPEGRFGKWAYLLWDYVAKNRLGAAAAIVAGTGLIVGTSGTGGTYTAAIATSGVAAGTYGSATVIPRFAVDAVGRLSLATNAGTLSAFSTIGTLVATGDVLGTSTTGTLTAALSTTGVAAGTYGGTGTLAQVTLDAKGRVSAAANIALGTMAQFTSYVLAGDVLGTSTTGTLTGALSTTGVTAGTYGGTGTFAQVTVDAKGRISAASSIALAAASPLAVSGGTVSHNTSGVVAGTYGGTLGAARFGVSAEGHITAAASHALEASAPLSIATGAGTFSWSHNTSGVTAGTYGTGRVLPQFAVDARGHLSSAGAMGTLGTFAGFDTYVLAGDVLGTSTTGTLTGALSTTGVTAGTYGGTGTFAILNIDAKGRVGSAGGFALAAAAPLAVGAGTVTHNTSGVAAGTYGGIVGIPRFDISAYGHVLAGTVADLAAVAPITLATNTGTVGVGTLSWGHGTSGVPAGTYGGVGGVPRFIVDALGHLTGATAADLVASAPLALATSTGTVGVGTFSWSHNTSGVAAGTYGTGRVLPQVVVDAYGHVTSAGAMGTLGTFAGFNSYVLAGDVLGTSTTGTLTSALSTTGVAAGTYGGTLGAARFGVGADGRITAAASHALEATTPILLATNAGTFSWSHATSGVTAGTYGTGRVLAQVVVDARGHVTAAAAAGTLGTLGYFDSYVLSGDVLGTSTTGTLTSALSTTGVTAGTYNQITVDAKGRVTAGGTSTSGPTWQQNRSYITSTETLSVSTGQQIVFGGELRVEGTAAASGVLKIAGTGAFVYNSSRAFIL